MARRIPRAQLEAAFAKRWNISTRQVRRYTEDVRARWREEALENQEARESQRDSMRASLNAVFSKAMTKTVVLKNASGDPVLDANGRPLTFEAPDLRAAVHASRVLMQLDALDQPQRVELSAQVEHKTTADGMKALEALLLGPRRASES